MADPGGLARLPLPRVPRVPSSPSSCGRSVGKAGGWRGDLAKCDQLLRLHFLKSVVELRVTVFEVREEDIMIPLPKMTIFASCLFDGQTIVLRHQPPPPHDAVFSS